jgi:hypothetical protein
MSKRAKRSDLIAQLPFVANDGFWCGVVSTGDFQADNEIGSHYAYLALAAIRAEKFQPLLGWIVMDMIKKGCPEGIVCGFFQTVADVCLGYYRIPDHQWFDAISKTPQLAQRH